MREKWNRQSGDVAESLVRKLMSSIKAQTRKFIRSNDWLNILIIQMIAE